MAIGIGIVVAMQEPARPGDWLSLIPVAAAGMAAVGIWILFFRSTRCGYLTNRGRPCKNPAPGELRGCRKYHKGLKAEALLNHVGLRHPRQRLQRVWTGGGTEPVPPPAKPGKLQRPAYDITMLVATISGVVAAVAMPIIQMMLA